MRPRDRATVRSTSPCAEPHDPSRHGAWGTVRTSVATTIAAPPDRLVDLFVDYTQWPRIFAGTIASTDLVRRDAHSLVVTVDHRREGRVVNVLTECGDGVVALREYKRRYDATFVNRFSAARGGTRYVIDAEVRIKQPFTLIAPLLRGVVQRALQQYTMEPLRAAAERKGRG